MLGYSSVKTLVSSHLYYLVAEWLGQRQSDDRYTLGSFPFTVLDQDTVRDFYRSAGCFHLLLWDISTSPLRSSHLLLSVAEGLRTRS